jgi:hypothetical protein
MAYSDLIKDAKGIPIPQVYIPGVGFAALAGSTGSNSDGSSNTSTGVNFNLNQVNNTALSGSNPVSIQDFIRTLILNGQGFSASASGTTAGAADPGLSIFNNSTAKNVLIYAITAVANATSTAGHSIRITTTDPALTGVTPVNAKAGGAASAIAGGCSQSNTQATLIQTLYENFGANANSVTELFANGRCLFLPANAANGFMVQFVFSGAQSWFSRVCWVEY